MRPGQVQAFCRALWRKEAKTVASLASRIDPNASDRWGNTPLRMAAQYGDLALVSALLARGGDVDQGRRHLTPITLAAQRKALDIVDLLRRQGATMSMLTWIYLGEQRRVEQELSRDPSAANLCDEAGTPALHHAVLALVPELVTLLLDHGADVNRANATGESALHQVADLRGAASEPARATAVLLLDRGADPNARNWDDVTPLHQAVRARNLAVVEVLLARGADVNARDKIRGSTPLRRAVAATGASGTAGTAALMLPLTRLLLEHGADPNACDRRGVPVHASARAPEICALLAQYRKRKPAKKGPAPLGRPKLASRR
jgi:uncharacterized protein